MLCIACEGNSSRFGADKNHICPRLINGVVIQGVLATDEPSARRDRWQDAVDAEVAHVQLEHAALDEAEGLDAVQRAPVLVHDEVVDARACAGREEEPAAGRGHESELLFLMSYVALTQPALALRHSASVALVSYLDAS